jgi:hypothetical protein
LSPHGTTWCPWHTPTLKSAICSTCSIHTPLLGTLGGSTASAHGAYVCFQLYFRLHTCMHVGCMPDAGTGLAVVCQLLGDISRDKGRRFHVFWLVIAACCCIKPQQGLLTNCSGDSKSSKSPCTTRTSLHMPFKNSSVDCIQTAARQDGVQQRLTPQQHCVHCSCLAVSTLQHTLVHKLPVHSI